MPRHAALLDVAGHLPAQVLTNQELADLYPTWPAEKIEAKTGIRERRIAGPDELASDLAAAAAEELFSRGRADREQVDYVLFCTQSPDYVMPTTACLLQDRLNLPQSAGALDFNLGCSGFVYGLGLAKGLVESGQASQVLLLTAETYSKWIHPQDYSVRTLFGDGAAAALIGAVESDEPALGPFVYGTDGSGAANLMVRAGGLRHPQAAPCGADQPGEGNLSMNGGEVFAFSLRAVPAAVDRLLVEAELDRDEVDLWVLHQANQYMLEHLRRKIQAPPEKFVIAMAESGNTVSATIPLALRVTADEGRLQPGHRVAVVGFGIGYSWAAGLLRWQG